MMVAAAADKFYRDVVKDEQCESAISHCRVVIFYLLWRDKQLTGRLAMTQPYQEN